MQLDDGNSNIDLTHTGCYVIRSHVVITHLALPHHFLFLAVFYFTIHVSSSCSSVPTAGGAQHFHVSFPD